VLANLWRHECGRVFCDKLTNNKDKAAFSKTLDALTAESFGDAVADACKGEFFMVNFLKDDVYDDDGVLISEAPKVCMHAHTAVVATHVVVVV
jgi:dynein heavy chain, axonemal